LVALQFFSKRKKKKTFGAESVNGSKLFLSLLSHGETFCFVLFYFIFYLFLEKKKDIGM